MLTCHCIWHGSVCSATLVTMKKIISACAIHVSVLSEELKCVHAFIAHILNACCEYNVEDGGKY